ncbi:MAG TPA: class I SAM-dependent methyltransferase [Aquella sp.]|nr:class I SAM-dependent methyltransferase [Aquella sp.]
MQKGMSNINLNKLISVYGTDHNNWGNLENFKGDYINFGFWKDYNFNKIITIEERIQSSINLYLQIIDRLDIKKDDTVLEVGCGRGVGVIETSLQYPCKKIYALDINPVQLERSKDNIYKVFSNSSNIELVHGSAEHTTLPDNSVDKIYSVEAAQHFESMQEFAREAKRILKQDGGVVFTSYFLKDNVSSDVLRETFPLINEKLENLTQPQQIFDWFMAAGFRNIKVIPIGEYVFYGYDKWIEEKGVNPFSYEYYKAYKNGSIEYYIFVID